MCVCSVCVFIVPGLVLLILIQPLLEPKEREGWEEWITPFKGDWLSSQRFNGEVSQNLFPSQNNKEPRVSSADNVLYPFRVSDSAWVSGRWTWKVISGLCVYSNQCHRSYRVFMVLRYNVEREDLPSLIHFQSKQFFFKWVALRHCSWLQTSSVFYLWGFRR